MGNILDTLARLYPNLLLWMAGFFVVFNALAYFFPCNPGQSWKRPGVITDIIYYFAMPLINRIMGVMLLGAGIFFLFRDAPQETINDYLRNGYGILSTLPLWVQTTIVVILSDIYLYWSHRWFHGKTMWKFHAIHHSPKYVDWLSTYRFHPINSWLSFVAIDTMMLIAGFSPVAVTMMASINMAYSAMVHANLNWTFGPFKYLFASPVFHRWHHTTQAEGLDKNFAPTFPLLDVMFGTFYMPEGKVPQEYGITGTDMPENFFKQLLWPFKQGS